MKRFLAILLAVLMMFSIVACGSKPETKAPAEKPADNNESTSAILDQYVIFQELLTTNHQTTLQP